MEYIHVAAVIAGWETGKWIVSRVRLRYRWKCSQCNFSMATNSREGYERVKAGHTH